MAKKGHPSAGKTKKTPTPGTGGHGRRALEGRGPTPKAEDRPWHPAGKKRLAKDRLEAARDKHKSRLAAEQPRLPRKSEQIELVIGRNSVIEVLKTATPAVRLFVVSGLQSDGRINEALVLAKNRAIPMQEVTRAELEQITGAEGASQGIALQVPEYEYLHPLELADRAENSVPIPIFVALDGVTDPRNLGAIIRSAAAFGAFGIVLPKRRSVGVTAAVWKTSAGALATTPVSMASNLTQTLKEFQARGYMVVGLDGSDGGDLKEMDFSKTPLVLVVGGEGKGLTRLVAENCDRLVRIPISERTESLNASVAASVVLYEVSKYQHETSD